MDYAPSEAAAVVAADDQTFWNNDGWTAPTCTSRHGPTFFVPPYTLAIGDPVRVLVPGSAEVPDAIRQIGFASVAFGVDAEWTDRVSRYERTAEVRVEEFGAHADDDLLEHQDTDPAAPT